MRVLGIDPGMSGAVALWDTRTQSLDVRRNFKRLSHIATAVKDLCADGVTFAVVELVGARPGQGVTSMFTFGRSAGAAMGALDVLGVPFVEVAPAKWVGHYRKQFGLEDVDFNSPEVAGRMFPNFLSLFARKLDLGGGLAVDFGPDNGERYERRIVKIDSQCEVVATGVGPA